MLFWHSYSYNLLYSQKCPILYNKLYDHPFHDIQSGEICGHSLDFIFPDFSVAFHTVECLFFLWSKTLFCLSCWCWCFLALCPSLFALLTFPIFSEIILQSLILLSVYTSLLTQLVFSGNSYTNWIFWKLNSFGSIAKIFKYKCIFSSSKLHFSKPRSEMIFSSHGVYSSFLKSSIMFHDTCLLVF